MTPPARPSEPLHTLPGSGLGDLDFARRLRRAIHRWPELAHHERRTAALIERVLALLGLKPFRPAPTSVAVVVGPAGVKPAIGFRADIDAVPVEEAGEKPYRSRTAGVAHACGHDGHVALLLTLARRLSARPPRRPVLLVFQQAEESYPSGAPLVLGGLPAELRPPEFVAFHIWPELPAGTVGVREGPLLPAVAGITVEITGRPGRAHGTQSEAAAVDALAAAVRLYGALPFRTGRHPEPADPVALNVGVLAGGRAPNSVPAECTLRATLRSLTWRDQDAAVAEIRRLANEIATATGTSVETEVISGVRPPVWNTRDSVDRVRAAAASLGIDCVDYPAKPVGVSDDFGWYLVDGSGVLCLLGCARGPDHPDLHTADFDFDESALLPAVELGTVLSRGGESAA
ncbi:M20 metallopeptidase family protein [Kutzneria sp. CA-103260]|uniref:M20 metallopeptidase family protein n=1 Tax=Kutzneria sp. CA-103260 TaxID=2802641 RepID=UPI001BA85CED|nr:amidohydrolase [Kutzneria sp. CA-103260]QUQ68821.1 amidohydrolase [Kutzneria sp. CA-103260]